MLAREESWVDIAGYSKKKLDSLRRSYREGGCKVAIHMISAFRANQRLVLGQKHVSYKSNEITAITELSDLLAIEHTIATIDAMGRQHKIASKIIAKKLIMCLLSRAGQPEHIARLC